MLKRAAVIALCLALPLCSCAGRSVYTERETYWMQRLAKEVPIGSSKTDVEVWIRANQLELIDLYKAIPSERAIRVVLEVVENHENGTDCNSAEMLVDIRFSSAGLVIRHHGVRFLSLCHVSVDSAT